MNFVSTLSSDLSVPVNDHRRKAEAVFLAAFARSDGELALREPVKGKRCSGSPPMSVNGEGSVLFAVQPESRQTITERCLHAVLLRDGACEACRLSPARVKHNTIDLR